MRYTFTMVIPWDEESWGALRLGDVYRLPLAIETNWAADGWEVNLILVGEVQSSGYSAHLIWTYREPYGDGPHTEQVDAMHQRAMNSLGSKLRALLNDGP